MLGDERLDLDAYFSRVAYEGPTTPRLDTLAALVLAHTSAIPFSNLEILLGQPVLLDLASVQRKLVAERGGGYCFEQNGLLFRVLCALGFEVTAMGGRVRLKSPQDVVPQRTHMVLRVAMGGHDWLVDAGLGGLTPTAPLRMDAGVEQATPHERRRLVGGPFRWVHQVLVGADWVDAYDFTTETLHPIDQELANWWTSGHPDSSFRKRLVVAKAEADGGRVTMDNNMFRRRVLDVVVEQEEIASPASRLAILETQFGLCYPPETRWSWDAIGSTRTS